MDADVAIVGGGPIGIELAVALKERGISTLHFEAGQVGATMFWWPPQTRWFSSNDRIAIAGVPLQTVDQSIFGLFQKGFVTYEEALHWCSNVDEFKLRVQGISMTGDMARDQMAASVIGTGPAGAGAVPAPQAQVTRFSRG